MTDPRPEDESKEDADKQRWPIGFMLLIAALSLYLGWRLIQGVAALIRWLGG
jgi:hypothetical protein